MSDSSHPGESGGGGKMIVLVVYRELSCVLTAYALAARRKALVGRILNEPISACTKAEGWSIYIFFLQKEGAKRVLELARRMLASAPRAEPERRRFGADNLVNFLGISGYTEGPLRGRPSRPPF